MEHFVCEVNSREGSLSSRSWRMRDEALSALTRALSAHASSPTVFGPAQSQLPRLQSTDSNSSSVSSVPSQSQFSPPTSEAHHTCERCDSIGPAGIAREAVTKATHIKGAKEYLIHGLLVWLAAQVEEKVYSGALDLDGYLATMGAVANAVTSLSCEASHSQEMLPFWDAQDQPAKKPRFDFVQSSAAAPSLASIPEWTSAVSSSLQQSSFSTGHQQAAVSPAQSIMPGGTMGLAPGLQDVIDDVSWARHQLLKDRYLLHLQVCHLASLTRIQEHYSGITAPGGSARATRVLAGVDLRTLQDMKRMSLALVRFFAARRERVPSKFSIEKLDCLESESRSVLSAMRSMAANGTLSIPVLLLRGVPGLQRTATWQQACPQVCQRPAFRVPSELHLPPAAAIAPSNAYQLGAKRPWCDMIGGEEGQGNPCLVRCNTDSACQSTVMRGNGAL